MKTRLMTFALSAILLIGFWQTYAAQSHPTETNETGSGSLKVGFFPAAGRYAGFYAAIAHGIYAQYQLDVEFVPIYGGEDRLAALRAGQVDIILNDVAATILAQEAGAAVKIIGILEATSSLATLSKQSTGIETPSDYPGHVFGAKPGGIELKLLPVIAHLNNFDEESVDITELDFSALLPSLLNDSVDFVITFYDSGSYSAERIAAEAGQPLNVIQWADYGLDIYGDSVVSSQELLENSPDLVRRFLQASMEGFVYAAEHTDDVPELVKEFAPLEELEDIAVDWSRGLANLSDEATQMHGLGYIDADKFATTENIVLESYGLTSSLADADQFSNEFLPGEEVNIPVNN